MGDFDDLLHTARRKANESKTKEDKTEPPLRQPTGKRPDALVMVHKTQHCACGSTWEGPNPLLLLRYGRTKQQVDHFPSSYNSLPREVEEMSENVPACPTCFHMAIFEGKQVISKKRK